MKEGDHNCMFVDFSRLLQFDEALASSVAEEFAR
jgi:hypothetical protein